MKHRQVDNNEHTGGCASRGDPAGRHAPLQQQLGSRGPELDAVISEYLEQMVETNPALDGDDPEPPAREATEPCAERVVEEREGSAITKDTDVASGAKTPGSMEGSRTPAISPDTKAGVGPSETEPPPPCSHTRRHRLENCCRLLDPTFARQ